ncbi:LA_3696 family protein [Rhodothermus marinus]|uniref:LA_3696 family protein n=1 Tax=Rhodothermus marinus TaxID=29549 RepID=UPI0012BA4596|nr:DUF1640 domain-containing protein [Rhodothermus marinus]BBM68288.1 hypothetical protein RmaAA213_01340 [Rhodothermus marinus]BBM71261.1 hypothetical protein RmaAA338_01260 [Rhodothermus marinus]
MAILTIPKVLREKLGDDGVEALITLLNEAAHHERNNLLGILEERFERRVTEEGKRLDNRITEETAKLDHRITEEIAKLDSRITEETSRLKLLIAETEKRLDQRITEEVAKLQQQIAAVDNRITSEMAKMGERIAGVRADLIRWMFIFWVGQIGTLIALLFAFLR